MVGRDDDYALAREHLAVLARFRGRAGLKAAAVDPEHHGQHLVGLGGRRPDVEVEAVLAHLVAEDHVVEDAPLGTPRAERNRLLHRRPGRPRSWRLPSAFANRRRGKRDPLEDAHAAVGRGRALDRARLGLDLRRRGATHADHDRHHHAAHGHAATHHLKPVHPALLKTDIVLGIGLSLRSLALSGETVSIQGRRRRNQQWRRCPWALQRATGQRMIARASGPDRALDAGSCGKREGADDTGGRGGGAACGL